MKQIKILQNLNINNVWFYSACIALVVAVILAGNVICLSLYKLNSLTTFNLTGNIAYVQHLLKEIEYSSIFNTLHIKEYLHPAGYIFCWSAISISIFIAVKKILRKHRLYVIIKYYTIFQNIYKTCFGLGFLALLIFYIVSHIQGSPIHPGVFYFGGILIAFGSFVRLIRKWN